MLISGLLSTAQAGKDLGGAWLYFFLIFKDATMTIFWYFFVKQYQLFPTE